MAVLPTWFDPTLFHRKQMYVPPHVMKNESLTGINCRNKPWTDSAALRHELSRYCQID
jgi:hypothetical protein